MKRYQMMGWAALLLGGAVFSTDTWGQTPLPTLLPNRGFGLGRFGDPGRRSCSERNRRNRSGNNQGVTVIYPGSGDYGNSSGYPPWVRFNYYAPWMSDYDNGTAWQNIPTSHAASLYGFPGQFPDSVTDRAAAAANATTAAASAYSNASADAASVDYVVAVQRELRRRGFYRGVVNGVSDEPTRAAIRAYETSLGMPATGIIGMPLLQTLGFL